MRPVRLEMAGFAAFRDAAVVDFADADFFVLVGATGSGKSTVIDALTFALYGTVPRWNHRSMVMYGLAPTANRGTVRLVFDLSDNGADAVRYVAARELRRTKAGVQVRNARLERLVDRAALGGVDDATEVLAADKEVSPAVEKLLGLPYEHFCQCVVLPQGEFADFLRAKPADRRAILLRLLGAGLYGDIGQRANQRAALAGQTADLLAEQLLTHSEDTAAAESAARDHVGQLQQLADAVTGIVPGLRAAVRDRDAARRDLELLASARDRLADVRPPAGLLELDGEQTAADDAVAAARQRLATARAVDRAARDRLAAAGDRARLERARRDHAELARVRGDRPDAARAAQQADRSLSEAEQAVTAAAAAVERARSVRDIAHTTVTALQSEVAADLAAVTALSAVAVPPDLPALTERTAQTTAAVDAARTALEAAEEQLAAQAALLAEAPDREWLATALTLAEDLGDALRSRAPLADEAARATAAQDAAHADLAAAQRRSEEAGADRDHAAITHRAVGLRADLVVGNRCPVCAQTVAALPGSGDDPDAELAAAAALKAAQAAVRTADAAREQAQQAERTAAAVATQAATRLATLDERIAEVRKRIAAHGTEATADPADLRTRLADRDRLAADERAAAAGVRAAHARSAAADTAQRQLTAAVGQARAAVRAARDPLVSLGAPALDEDDPAAAWSALARWAAATARTRSRQQQARQAALAGAQAAVLEADAAFASADDADREARQAQTAAAADRARAHARVDALVATEQSLVDALAGSPDPERVDAALAAVDAAAAAAGAADTALVDAERAATLAEQAAGRTADRVAAAARELRAARDAVVDLGAPDLHPGGADASLLAGWTTLTAWAAAAAGARTAALPAAEQAVTVAQRRQDRAVADLVAAFTDREVPFPGADHATGPDASELADTAPTVAATALATAAGRLDRLVERRAQAAALQHQLDAAREEQQVARLLGNLLRSNQFPEWLEAAALDTLVVDASRRLFELSGGQFELTHRDGEFMVVDHADADSIRSVRTLSGGETFQASLALALALSTQLSSLAADGAARLDAIFLDEGFGTLDESTLEVVASTLESLAQGSRMVGVVTHVTALADRIPVRFAVRRDQRTSSITREAP